MHAFDLEKYRGKHMDETSDRIPADARKAFAYDKSKADGERAVREVCEAANFDHVILHPTGIFGPADYDGPCTPLSRMGLVIKQMRDGTMQAITRSGGFDFVDVRDVVQAIVAAATKGRSGESYILACGRQIDFAA